MNASPEKVHAFPGLSYDDVRQNVREAMQAEGLTNATVARESGVATSTLSEFLNGKYKGNQHEVAQSLLKWLNSRAQTEQLRQLMPGVPGWIETPTSTKIINVLTYAQAFNDFVVIYGGAGVSKTTSLRRYKEKNPNVFIVTATPATAGAAVMLAEIAMALGMKDFPMHPARLQSAIVQKVTGSNGLLAIDEAQHLTKQALESARSIHDATGVGLAFLGNASVYNQVYGKNDNGFAQLYSRIGRRLALKGPQRGDMHAIASAFGIRDKESLDLCESIARKPGALRMMVKSLRLARAGAGDQPVTADHIAAAYHELQGEDGGSHA